MSRTVILPYRVVPEHVLSTEPAEGWLARVGEGQGSVVRSGDVLESWDYETKLRLSRRLTLPANLARTLALDSATRFVVVVSGLTGGGLLRRPLASVIVEPGTDRVDLEVSPASSCLSGDLTLQTTLTVAHAAVAADELAPCVPGQRIWHDAVRIRLEGGRARLPMAVASFSSEFARHGLAGALFHVEVAPHPELDFEQTVLVYLNADFPRFVDQVGAGEAVATALLWEAIVRRLIHLATVGELVTDSDIADPLEPGSLGSTLRRWLSLAFPTMAVAEVCAMAREAPSRFEAVLQAFVGTSPRLFSPGEKA